MRRPKLEHEKSRFITMMMMMMMIRMFPCLHYLCRCQFDEPNQTIGRTNDISGHRLELFAFQYIGMVECHEKTEN